MKLADRIMLRILAECRSNPREIMVPNFYYGKYEMDVFKLMPSGVVVEYEIKTTRWDYKNDFKKSRARYGQPEVFKHDAISAGKGECNRFFFVVPAGLIGVDEVPKHAGLIYYERPRREKAKHLLIIKPAPLIRGHTPEPDIYKSLCVSLSFREHALRFKLLNQNKNE